MLTSIIGLLFLAYSILLSLALARAGVRDTPSVSSAAPRPRPTKVLIIGATGGTGRQLVTQALELGYTVTALVRDPSRLPVDHPRLTILQGNVLDQRSVDTAMRGQEAVLSALGHKRFLGPTRILSAGTANILRAMISNGVSRLVCETALGIGDSAGRMGLWYTLFVVPVILPFYFWDKAQQERLVARAGVDWVLVRPGVLTNGAGRGRVRHGGGLGSYLFTVRVARADVADFMLRQLDSDEYLRRAPGVCW